MPGEEGEVEQKVTNLCEEVFATMEKELGHLKQDTNEPEKDVITRDQMKKWF